MNRYWYISLFYVLTLGCNGQKPKMPEVEMSKHTDSLAQVTEIPLREADKSLGDTVSLPAKQTDSIPMKVTTKKKVSKPINKTEKDQTTIADIWNEEQVKFLKSANKILLYNIIITEIGSRKLELDSQLGMEEHHEFIKLLLSQESYPTNEMVEGNDGKKFEPHYQMLLEAGEEKLTLLFDSEGLSMMVANLYGREKHTINTVLMDYVDELKSKQ